MTYQSNNKYILTVEVALLDSDWQTGNKSPVFFDAEIYKSHLKKIKQLLWSPQSTRRNKNPTFLDNNNGLYYYST